MKVGFIIFLLEYQLQELASDRFHSSEKGSLTTTHAGKSCPQENEKNEEEDCSSRLNECWSLFLKYCGDVLRNTCTVPVQHK